MNPDRWQQVETLFEAAVALPCEEREAYLERSCGEDIELREEVLSLLARDLSVETPLEEFSRIASRHNPLLRLPETIGGFRILEAIGEGGMGTVYRAEQANPHRVVALKALHRLQGMAAEARFQRESGILARLRHPGIAQVYAAGVDAGRPYFAMELVDGGPLRTIAANLDIRGKIRLLIQICDAMEHAHSRGIVHRDLKPENILVDETGQPKVVDFGVAHLISANPGTLATKAGELIGTLAYMSPEQVSRDAADIDARSDVYSLGLIAYELLARRPAYLVAGNLSQAMLTIMQAEPQPIRVFLPGINRDVELIVGKALAKDRELRYVTAGGLGADLERYLRGEPIQARAAGAWYRARKFVARNRLLVVTVTAVLMGLTLALGAVSIQYRRALAAEQRTSALNEFLLNDLLAQANPNDQATAGGKTDPNITVRTALDSAGLRVGRRFADQPEMEAAIRDAIGRAYLGLGLHKESTAQLEQSLALYRRIVGEEDPRTAKAMSALGAGYLRADRDGAALELLNRAYGIQRKTIGEAHPDTMVTLNEMANVYQRRGDSVRATPILEKTIAFSRKTLGAWHPDTLAAENNLASAFANQGSFAKSADLYREILIVKNAALGQGHPSTLTTLNSLAVVERNRGHYENARHLLEQALRGRRESLGNEHLNTLASMVSLALLDLADGHETDAVGKLEMACEVYRRLYPHTGAACTCESNLAEAYHRAGRDLEAMPAFERSVALAKKELRAHDRVRYRVLAAYAEALAERQEWAKAEPVLREVATIQEQEMFADWRRYWLQALHGKTLKELRLPEEAKLEEARIELERLKDTIPFERRSLLGVVREWRRTAK